MTTPAPVVQVEPIPAVDKPILANLLELCLHDLSEFDDRDIGDEGRYGYEYIDRYWDEDGRFPLFIRADGQLAGFALVRVVNTDAGTETQLAEFFVLRKYRRRGIGSVAARRIFDAFPGHWVVAHTVGNHTAQEFWQAVITRYVGDRFTERRGAEQLVQEFETPVGNG